LKATGIVRKIDELGRVVIPKEIRRTLRIRVGDPLEIFTDREGLIVLKKYSPIEELGAFAKEYADTLTQTTGHIALIVDRDQIIAVAGGSKKEFLDKITSEELETALNLRTGFAASNTDANFISVLEDDDDPSYSYQYIAPIIAESDVIGAVILLSADQKMGEIEAKVATTAAVFLGKQMEN